MSSSTLSLSGQQCNQSKILACQEPSVKKNNKRKAADTALPPSIAQRLIDNSPSFRMGLSSLNSKTLLCVESEVAIDREEVEKMQNTLSRHTINAMNQFLNKHSEGDGIWYPAEYNRYQREMGLEMPDSFYTGHANPFFFEKTGSFTFTLKEGKKASEGLLSFLKGPTIADCGNAIIACYYYSIFLTLGDKFDSLFSSPDFPLTIGISGTNPENPLSLLAAFTDAAIQLRKGILGERPVHIGEKCYFKGVYYYGNKHPAGASQGWNVVYSGKDAKGNQLFMAHGFEKPLMENEIHQRLIRSYNKKRSYKDLEHIKNANAPALFSKRKNPHLKEHYTINWEEFEKNPEEFIEGFLANSPVHLNAVNLVRLKNASDPLAFMHQLKTEKCAQSRLQGNAK